MPELASRAHIRTLLPVVEQALQEADLPGKSLDAVAVTAGPGLVGSLLVGVNAAKGLAFAHDLQLIGVHHLEGHLLSAGIEAEMPPPFVALLVSGGHTELLHVEDEGVYRHLGRTLDDAAGEAFDKVARLLDLLPHDAFVAGGRAVAEAAAQGDPEAIDFPRSFPGRAGLDFSFSGLKTAVLTETRRENTQVVGQRRNDLAASFQQAVVDVLVRRTLEAVATVGVQRVALVGGVAANQQLRRQLRQALEQREIRLHVPEPILCTDNAAMIAVAGRFHLLRGERSGWDLDADPRLPLPGLTT